MAVSPLFGGRALKGPAEQVLESLQLPPGTAGVLASYRGLLSGLVIDSSDSDDLALSDEATTIRATDTRIADPEAGRRFARWLLDTMVP